MNIKEKTIFCVLPLFIFVNILNAQVAVTAAGGSFTGSGGNMSNSIGQVVYTTQSGPQGSVSQGVMQPFEISVILETEEAKSISLNYTAYPNPNRGLFSLSVTNYPLSDLSFQIYDLDGKLLDDSTIQNSVTKIDISNYISSTYIITITQLDKVIKTIQIIKN